MQVADIKEYAERTGLSQKLIRQFIKERKFRACRLKGMKWFLDVEECDKALKQMFDQDVKKRTPKKATKGFNFLGEIEKLQKGLRA